MRDKASMPSSIKNLQQDLPQLLTDLLVCPPPAFCSYFSCSYFRFSPSRLFFSSGYSGGLYKQGLHVNSHWRGHFSCFFSLFTFYLDFDFFPLRVSSFRVLVKFGPVFIFSLFILGVLCFVNLIFCFVFLGSGVAYITVPSVASNLLGIDELSIGSSS